MRTPDAVRTVLDAGIAGRLHQRPGRHVDWTTVGPETHAYFQDRLREMDTYLYGRRVYEGMAAFWPKPAAGLSCSAAPDHRRVPATRTGRRLPRHRRAPAIPAPPGRPRRV